MVLVAVVLGLAIVTAVLVALGTTWIDAVKRSIQRLRERRHSGGP
jgi:hypothetical protein